MADKDAGGEAERHQEQLRKNIAQSNRMIGEVQQRVAESRALTNMPAAQAKEELSRTA